MYFFIVRTVHVLVHMACILYFFYRTKVVFFQNLTGSTLIQKTPRKLDEHSTLFLFLRTLFLQHLNNYTLLPSGRRDSSTHCCRWYKGTEGTRVSDIRRAVFVMLCRIVLQLVHCAAFRQIHIGATLKEELNHPLLSNLHRYLQRCRCHQRLHAVLLPSVRVHSAVYRPIDISLMLINHLTCPIHVS